MGLSRLESFLKSVRGNLLHVDPNALDSTDSIENDGSSQMVPFKTINRALAEAARFSYQSGLDNDRFGRTTILLYPGQHIVDNRPGAVIDDSGNIKLRNGTNTSISQWSLETVYDLTLPNNDLYKLNSVHGGLILPRGVSIVAQDLRKTIIKPLYVPDPVNDNIERSAIFRLTGASFLYGFTVFDADPNGIAYKNYTTARETPTFSHHKLTSFEYADGVNNVVIDDIFNNITTTRTDLEMYYEKISLVYGDSSGRPINDVVYSIGASVDIQPVVDEFRIVGSRGKDFQISEIQSGNGFTPTNLITVTTTEPLEGISVDTPIQVSGVDINGYDGQFIVFKVLGTNQLQYKSKIIPSDPSPEVFNASFNIVTDTVSSASPYIFNVSLRSVYGMCGLHADGSKADGFKSIVVAQFTGIGLQKDDNAFVIYDKNLGVYRDSVAVENLYKNSRARFKPEYENYHTKVSEGAFCQLVSVFAIGFANQFLAETGGDYSITNSNSNFGAKALVSDGFSRQSFARDDVGFITKIIPPREVEDKGISIEFNSIDVPLTIAGSGGNPTTEKLYLYNEKDVNSPPRSTLDGFRIGAAKNEVLYLDSYTASVVIPNTSTSYEKSFNVERINNDTENNISALGVINFTQTDNFITGEKVRVLSDNGYLPDGITDKIYYAIDVTGGTNSQIKLAETFDSALNNVYIDINKKGGNLRIVSRVSDKVSGEIGHPIQWDPAVSNWYIAIAPNSTLYTYIASISGSPKTGRTYIKRTTDIRNVNDTIYRYQYVIPKGSSIEARVPLDGYIIQKSNKNLLGDNEISTYFGVDPLTNVNDLRSPKYISSVTWSAQEATVSSELNHNLTVGSKVRIVNVIPTGYNGTYTVKKVINSKSFVYDLENNPGTFSNNISTRDLNLPYFQPKETADTFKLYEIETVQDYIPEKQDGIYELIIVTNSVSPIVSPFNNIKLSQPVTNLYPEIDRDNLVSDPKESTSFADLDKIGQVVINDPEYSLTKEALNKFFNDYNVGFGVTSIISNSVGTSHTIYTTIDHGLSDITSLSIVGAGSSYLPGTYYGVNLQGATSGVNAKVSITVNASGNVSSVRIMDGGSNYAVGQNLSLIPPVGIGTTSGFVAAVVGVTSVRDNINDVISLLGYTGNYDGYNSLYRITSVPASNRIIVSSASTISNYSTSLVTANSTSIITGKTLSVSTLSYNRVVGIATITTSSAHNFVLNQRLRIGGFNQSFYNKDVFVNKIVSTTSIEVTGIGVSSSTPSTTGSGLLYPYGYNNSERGNARGRYLYDGVIATNTVQLLSTALETTPLVVSNAQSTGLKQGDFIELNGEVMRIKSPIVNNNVSVFRAQFGTIRKTHPIGSIIQRIRPIPVEFRRNTIIRASGHTFEYVGFGPGNYSTALPERQDRKLLESERIFSQAANYHGGAVYYSGTDDAGNFYIGNKKTISATGKEKVYDTPVQFFRGDKNITNEIVKTNDVVIDRSIRVGGGKDNDEISEFNGPVIFNEKITLKSEEGLELSSIFIQGDAETSRKYSVGISTPTFLGNPGDVEYKAIPNSGGYLGWVYTNENIWSKFGPVQSPDGRYVGIWSGSFFGDGSGLTNIGFDLWKEDAAGIYSENIVGVNTNAAKPGTALYVNGSTNIDGDLYISNQSIKTLISSYSIVFGL